MIYGMDSAAQEPLRLHIRKRPGMYIGGLNARALRHLIDDIVTEQLDAPGARPERVRCAVRVDGTYVVEVTGGEIPVIEPEDFTPDAGRFADWSSQRFFSLAIVSAFCAPLIAEVVRNGTRWMGAFTAGMPAGPPEISTAAGPPVLRIRYRPDPGLFPPGIEAGFLPLCGRAQEWAAFHPSVRFTIEDEPDGQRRDYHYPDGLLSLATEIAHEWAGAGGGLGKIWQCGVADGDGSAAEVVMVEHPTDAAVVYSYLNGRRTLAGGSHVAGLRAGAAAVIARSEPYERSHPVSYGRADEPLAGLTALVAVRLDDPRFGTATKDHLDDERAERLVHRMVESAEWQKTENGGSGRRR